MEKRTENEMERAVEGLGLLLRSLTEATIIWAYGKH